MRGATQDTVYTAWYGNAATASVLAAKDGAKAILSMTYDRKTDTARFINSMNKKYGLGGTFMLIAGRWNADNISEWKTLFADGTLDPGCLSMSHTPDTLEGPMSLHVNEIVNSKLRLEGLFPGYGIICFGSPYAQQRDFSYQTDANGNVVYDAGGNPVKVYDGGSKVLAAKTYFAVRNGTVGLNPLSPACSYDAGGWYNLMVQWIYDNDSQTDKVRTNWIDEAVKKGGWLVILAHDFTEGTPPDGYSTTWERGEIFFKHASTYIQSGELWAPSFTDATKYIRERQNATVARRVENGVVYVDLKLRRTTEDGLYMDESVFNYPLTVKVRVPASWQTVSYDQENGSVTATCYTDSADGQRYVNVNLVPGEDGAVTTTGIRKVN